MYEAKVPSQLRFRSKALSIFSAIVFALSPAFAQMDRAALSGTVTDPEGRVLPDVIVSAVQDANCQLDAGLGKRIGVSERVKLQFRAEVFNIFNHPQYAAPQANLSSGPGIFGSIISTVNTGPVGTGTPRQMQFVLCAEF